MINRFQRFVSLDRIKAVLLGVLLALGMGLGTALAQTTFTEGFESGTLSAWTTGSGAYSRTVTAVAPATGTYSLSLAGGGAYFDGISRTIAATTPSYIGFYAKAASTTALAGYFFVGDANTKSNYGLMNFTFSRTGEMLVFDGWNSFSGGAYAANTWYHIEFKNIDWTARKYDFYVNGIRKQSGIAFRAPGSTAITQIQLGNYDNTQSWFDDIQMGDGAVVTPPMTVQTFDVIARASGGNTALTLDFDVNMATADVGNAGSVYLIAAYPISATNMLWLTHNGSAWAVWNGGAVPAYFTGKLPSKQSIPILRGNDVQALAGLQLYAGYGTDAPDMLSKGHIKLAYAIAGTPAAAGGTVTGLNGSTITIPWGSTAPIGKISLTVGDATGLVNTGQKAVSPAYKIAIADANSAKGDTTYKLAIPLTTTVSDPDKLAFSVRLTSGTVVSILGEYDAAGNTYNAEFNGLVSGWNFQVVEEPQATLIKSSRAAGASPSRVSRWATTTQWNPCDAWVFRMAAPLSAAEAIFAEEVDALKAAAIDLCQKYSAMGFREPQMWISSKYGGRVINIAYKTKWGSYYDASDVVDTPPADEEELGNLGQIVIDYWTWKNVRLPAYGWELRNTLAHELFHAIQWGYDIRPDNFTIGTKKFQGLQAFTEGTATVLGMTYQMQGGFTGPKVFLRNGSPLADVLNGSGIDSALDGGGYPKQDYFGYVAKKYGNHSFAYLVDLFEELAKQSVQSRAAKTLGAQYVVYNQAMDTAFKKSFGIGLSEVFVNYALDRAYHLTTASDLRDTDAALAQKQLRADLFKAPIPVLAYADAALLYASAPLPPLTAFAFRIDAIPQANKLSGKLPLVFSISDGGLGADKIRIFAVPEIAGIAQVGQIFEVNQLDAPVDVPLGAADALSFLVVTLNANLADAVNYSKLTVTVPSSPKITSLSTSSGAVGAAVTVNGTGFGTVRGTVTFNGVNAGIGSWSDTAITTTVPTGATTGNVIAVVGGKSSNPVVFQVTTTTTPLPATGAYSCTNNQNGLPYMCSQYANVNYSYLVSQCGKDNVSLSACPGGALAVCKQFGSQGTFSVFAYDRKLTYNVGNWCPLPEYYTPL